MRATLEEHKVVVSAAIESEKRDDLLRRAIRGDRTLSQEIRRALSNYLARGDETEERTDEP